MIREGGLTLPDQARACHGNSQNSAFTDGDVEELYSAACSGVFLSLLNFVIESQIFRSQQVSPLGESGECSQSE